MQRVNYISCAVLVLIITGLFLLISTARSEADTLFHKWQDLKGAWLPKELIFQCYNSYKITNSLGSEIKLFVDRGGNWEEIDYHEINDTNIVLDESDRKVKLYDLSQYDGNEVWKIFASSFVPSYKFPKYDSWMYSYSFARDDHFEKYFEIQSSVTRSRRIDFISNELKISFLPNRINVKVKLKNSVEVWPEDGASVRVTRSEYFLKNSQIPCKEIL